MIAAVGEGWCFALDAVSSVGVIASLLAMKVTPRALDEAGRQHLLEELHHGWRYIVGFTPIRTALLLVAIVSAAGTPHGADAGDCGRGAARRAEHVGI
ncbi:MAG: hypothetical protein R2712_08370 [Vicinamibacterales bacterium]